MSARVAVTDHAIARLLERAPRFKGMPEEVIAAAMGDTTRAGTDPSGKVLLAPRAFPGLLFVVAEEARGPVVVSVVPHPAAGRGAEPSAEPSSAEGAAAALAILDSVRVVAQLPATQARPAPTEGT